MIKEKIGRSRCTGCIYRRPMTAVMPHNTVCHFMLDTGISRGCTAAQCTRWRPSSGAVKLLHTITAENGGDKK